jgi:hypothetical protein
MKDVKMVGTCSKNGEEENILVGKDNTEGGGGGLKAI